MPESDIIRYGIVRGARTRSEVEAYLPDNYRVIWEGQWEAYEGAAYQTLAVVIAGRDNAGWGLGSYVIPRLGSGSIACQEIDLSHPVMKIIPVEPRRAREGASA